MPGHLIDSHCHLHMDYYDKDRQQVIRRSREGGLALMITVGIDTEDSWRALTLAQGEPDIFCTVGIHPHDAGEATEHDMERLEAMAREEKVVAIGETGLDYYRNLSPRETQKKIFIQELELARSLKKPVVIHCRDAYRVLISIMMDHKARDIGGVIHCFSGDQEAAKAFLNMGFFLSFAGNITYPKAESLREVLTKVPKDRILMETDSPFLAPQEKRGKRNEPLYIQYTYKKTADILNISMEELQNQVNRNLTQVFSQTKGILSPKRLDN